jgi:hypothetical protein
MKLNRKNLIEVMRRCMADGDKESYEKLWKAITWLWNLGLVDQKVYQAMVSEDHRAWEAGDQDNMLDKWESEAEKALASWFADSMDALDKMEVRSK